MIIEPDELCLLKKSFDKILDKELHKKNILENKLSKKNILNKNDIMDAYKLDKLNKKILLHKYRYNSIENIGLRELHNRKTFF